MCIKLYTSRVILQMLGVMDFGLWNVVAGLIMIIGYLNASMSGCTHRFISYELGNGNRQSLQQVFSASLTIHLAIALVVLLLGQTVGLWFLQHKLDVPVDRVQATHIIYQLSLASTVIGILQVPFNASVMAHERLDVYAVIEIANALLKLAVACALTIVSFDRLVALGAMTTASSVIIFLCYLLYCLFRLPACRCALSANWARIRPMLSFSGWDLYGNMSVMARTQGVSMLLNIFFTAAMNAAYGVASSVQWAVMSFADNVVLAFRPQIIKSYASGDYPRMLVLVQKAVTYTLLLLCLLMMPLIVEMDYVLRLWLGQVPAWSALFARLVLLTNLIGTVSLVLTIGIHATGHIRQLSLLNGTLYALVIPFSWAVFRHGGQPYWPFVYNVVIMAVCLLLNLGLLHRLVPAFSRGAVLSVVLRIAAIQVVTFVVLHYLTQQFPASFLRLLSVVAISSVLTLVPAWFFIFGHDDRSAIVSFVLRRKRSL